MYLHFITTRNGFYRKHIGFLFRILTAIPLALGIWNGHASSADLCPNSQNTITAAQGSADNCLLDAGESVRIDETGGLDFSGLYAININGAAGGIDNAGSVRSNNDAIILGTGDSLGAGIVNSGSVASASSGPAILAAGGSTITGGIGNSGNITGTGRGIAIRDASTTLAGGITNSASIIGQSDAGIGISNGATAGGGIDNAFTGFISGRNFGVLVTINASLDGSITNAGRIESTTQAAVGIVNTATLNGDIVNSGELASANNGIAVTQTSAVNGHVINRATGRIDATNDGIVVNQSTVASDIDNQGTIAAFDGDTINLVGASTSIGGNLANSGFLTAGDYGIHVNMDATVAGNITNSGDISTRNLDGIAVQNSGTVDGDIVNGTEAAITSARVGILVDSNGTVGGTIENAGTIDAVANGIGIGGSSTVTGQLRNSGVITATSGLLVDSSDVGSLVNSGVITATGDGISLTDTVIAGTVVNSGTINAADVGLDIDNLTGAGNVTNTGTIAGDTAAIRVVNSAAPIGFENSGILDGDVILANSRLRITGDEARVAGDISGDAGSSVTIDADFTAEGSFDVGTLDLTAGNTLNIASDIRTASGFANAGELALAGNSVNMTGDYTQLAGSTLAINATSGSDYGRLLVSGTADLSGSQNLRVEVQPDGQLHHGLRLEGVLESTTLLAPAAIAVIDNSALLNFIGVVDANAIDLDVASSSVEEILGRQQGGGNEGIGNTLDEMIESESIPEGLQDYVNALNALSTNQQLVEAASQMVPAVNGGGALLNIVTAQTGANRTVQDRMRKRSPSNEPCTTGANSWIDPFGVRHLQQERRRISGFDGFSAGIAAGHDMCLSDRLLAGGALSYSRARYDGRGTSQSRIAIDSWQATAYSVYETAKETYLGTMAGIAYNRNDSERRIDFATLDRTALADYSSWHTTAGITIGRKFRLNDRLSVIPEMNAAYTHAQTENYSESGAGGANLEVDRNDADSLILEGAGRIVYHSTDILSFTGDIGIGHDVMAGGEKITSSFAGGGDDFETRVLEPDAFGLRLALGAEQNLADGRQTHIGYQLDVRDDLLSHRLVLRIRF